MKIGLDYDETYTKDPILWAAFVALARAQGHEVRIVTARSPTEDKIEDVGDIPVIYCDGVAKRFHCTWFANDRKGWIPDVWIDDKPQSVDNNSTATREHLEKWRAER